MSGMSVAVAPLPVVPTVADGGPLGAALRRSAMAVLADHPGAAVVTVVADLVAGVAEQIRAEASWHDGEAARHAAAAEKSARAVGAEADVQWAYAHAAAQVHTAAAQRLWDLAGRVGGAP